MTNELALMGWEGHEQFVSLSDAGRKTVRLRCEAIDRIFKAPRGSRGAVIAEVAKEFGTNESTVRLWITKFKRTGGDWRSQIDMRKEPHRDQALPVKFLEFWKLLCTANHRSALAAHRVLRELYWTGATEYSLPKSDEIIVLWPGYASRPPASPTNGDDLPRGWSYANLKRFGLTKVEELLAHRGPIAAGELQEMILNTRRGLKPGQHYCPDDCWTDVKVTVAPSLSRHAVRVVELGCLDIASAKKIAWGLTPMVTNDEGRRNYIKKRDMRYLMAKILCVVGFHCDGMTMWVEHGAAGIDPTFEEIIVRLAKSILNVEIKIKRSGIKGGQPLAGGYNTIGRGNCRFKAGTESNHNLAHNERAMLPGQTGKDMKNEPVEEMHGRDKETHEILTAIQQMRPAVAAAMRTGYLTFAEYFWAHAEAERRIAGFRDHHLEGWADNEITMFRLAHDAPWQPISNLDKYSPEQRAFFDMMAEKQAGLVRPFQMSREEVWQRGQADLVRLPLHCVPELLGPEHARKVIVGDKPHIRIEDIEIASEPIYYRARVKTIHGFEEQLPKGEYRAWVFENVLIVSGVKGNYLGICEQIDRIERGDDAAFYREAATVKKHHDEMLAPQIARQRVIDAQVTRNRKKNLELGYGGPATATEREVEEARNAADITDADIREELGTHSAPPQEPPSDSEVSLKDF